MLQMFPISENKRHFTNKLEMISQKSLLNSLLNCFNVFITGNDRHHH